ncbi:Vacuolar protein sorting-associated protein 13D [Strongyloides ratti]|uniref:Vacuolar protein sorting-associated protein 13D n=1 Tax=Strongyloides ratti TaxID=34506 RepID=A0A090LI07_STRRB|nr:Vacuolar protein sorting-associated protein 13D [Strongyloides ratti]CEF67763.1 Vacuolar protein sorting-associated protein 13D [Strongyloides ratti]
MLEGYLASVLNRYVGEYLEDLNTDQLSIALLSGQVELENVPLKKTALSKFDVPVDVKSGIVGKLSVTIPITALRSEPWVIKLNDVFILLGPSERQFLGKDQEEKEIKRKEDLLKDLEETHKKIILKKANLLSNENEGKNQWWGTSILSSIVKNIHLIITNIHIRYEDNKTISQDIKFSFGLKIKKINIYTTDEQWQMGFVSSDSNIFSYKKLNIDGASMYWNTYEKQLLDVKTLDELKNFFSSQTFNDNSNIIKPFDLKIKITKNKSKLHLISETNPRFKFDILQKKMNIDITIHQLIQMKILTNEWKRFDRAKNYRKWRPKNEIYGNAVLWWKFAIGRIIDNIKKKNLRNTWEYVLSKTRIINKYSFLYKKKLILYLRDEIKNNKKQEVFKYFDTLNEFVDLDECKKETFYIKQIERDTQMAYSTLSILRDCVCKKLINNIEFYMNLQKINIDKCLIDKTINVSGISMVNDFPVKINGEVSSTNENTSNLYNWFASWFPKVENNYDKSIEKNDIINLNNDKNFPIFKSRELPANFKKVEKKMEEDLFEALNEMLDDSAIFVRDKILAVLSAKVEDISLRIFIDNSENSDCNIFLVDLSKVSFDIQLSAREHKSTILLNVGDFNIQCTKISSQDRDQISILNDSNYNVFNDTIFNSSAQILFTIRRSKINLEGYNFIEKNIPLVSMTYSRFSPKTTVFHSLNAKFCPLSIIIDESSKENFLTILNLCSYDDSNIKKFYDNQNEELIYNQNNHFYCSIKIPLIDVILKTKKKNLFNQNINNEKSEIFVTLAIEGASIGVSRTEEYLTKYKIGIRNLCLRDFYEKKFSKLLEVTDHQSQFSNRKRSNSFPGSALSLIKFKEETDSYFDISNKYSRTMDNEDIHIRYKGCFNDKFSRYTEEDFEISDNDQLIITIIHVQRSHHQFSSHYKEIEYNIEMEVSYLDIEMNRLTWVIIQDILGFLPRNSNKSESSFSDDWELQELLIQGLHELDPTFCIKEEHSTKMRSMTVNETKNKTMLLLSKNILLNLNVQEIKLLMNLPKNEYSLGTIYSGKVQFNMILDINNEELPIEMILKMNYLKVDNLIPTYNNLYKQVFSVEKNKSHNNNVSFIETKIIKYRNYDHNLERPFDIKIDVSIDETFKFAYLHIHKFFDLVTDFWINYVDLLDQFTQEENSNMYNNGNLLSRILLDFKINCSGFVVLPSNQFSPKCIMMKMEKVEVSNKFILASQLKYMDDYDINRNILQDNYDCLFDNIDIFVSDLEVFEGEKISKNSKIFSNREKFFDGLKDIFFNVNLKSILSKKYQTKIIFGRNLSSLVSQNAPNMTSVLLFENVDITLTTEFYKLIQAILQNNLGDNREFDVNIMPLKYKNNTSLNYCDEYIEQCINISSRIQFSNSNIKLLVPSNTVNDWDHFCTISCADATLSFDGFVKFQCEINFTAYSVEFFDTRFNSIQNNLNKEIFSKLLYPKNNVDNSKRQAIWEMHIFNKNCDPPIITFVLQKTRLLFLPDWFLTLKEFLLLEDDFVFEDVSQNTSKFINNFENDNNQLRKKSIFDMHNVRHTVTMKAQLTDSDIIFIENFNDPKTLAIICSTTSVLQLSDKMGFIEAELIIQKMEISWCIFVEENDTICVLSTPFNVEIKIGTMSKNLLSNTLISSSSYNDNFNQDLLEYYITSKIDNCSFRLSYKDSLVVMNVLNGSMKLFDTCFSQLHWVPIPKDNALAFNMIKIKSISCTLSDCSLWILNDFDEPTLPIIRLSSVKWKVIFIEKKFTSEGILSIEYFNHRLSGWEPFLEPVEISNFNFEYQDIKSIYNEFKVSPKSCMNFNITTHLIQQFKRFLKDFSHIKKTVDTNFRNLCGNGRPNNMSYVIKNKLGCVMYFTTEINKLLNKDEKCRKSVKWYHVEADQELSFSLPVDRNHLYGSDCTDYSRLVLSIDEYEELQPINIDTVRIYNISTKKSININQNIKSKFTKLLVTISIDNNGRKAIDVRTAYSITNYLNVPILLKIGNFLNDDIDWNDVRIFPNQNYFIPLKYVHSKIYCQPIFNEENLSSSFPSDYLEITLNEKQYEEKIVPSLFKKFTQDKKEIYALLSKYSDDKISTKIIPGLNIYIYPPLFIRNQLPTDIYCNVNGQNIFCQAADMISLTNINVNENVSLKFMTDRLESINLLEISRNHILKLQDRHSKSIVIKMIDEVRREINIYADVSLTKNESIIIVLWVPYWVVNKSGIPLIIKKHEALDDIPGQSLEHEQGKDRIPLMVSFNVDDEIQKCNLRIGRTYLPDKEYFPEYSDSFKLTPGEQSLVLYMKHQNKPTLIYNVGIEVRQGTGRYKNTQVVIFTPRYLLINRSSYNIYLSHVDDTNSTTNNILKSNSNIIWNESFEGNRMICIKRHDVKHWSQPFRIDQVGSYFITMRDYDETPNFVRAEITLNNARFCITFSNTEFYPPPIQIINDSSIPVLYQQLTKNSIPNHLKSICKGHTKIDYAWDFLYDQKLLTLQVYNNSSHSYDPSKSTIGPSLCYENYSFIFLESSMSELVKSNTYNNLIDGLVLTVVDSNYIKLMPIKKNGIDLKQLWNFSPEGVIESVGVNNFEPNSSNNYVLDLHYSGTDYKLTVKLRQKSRNKTQIWKFDEEGRFSCGISNGYLARNIKNFLVISSIQNYNTTDSIFKRMYQKEGTGVLNVQCSHIGPTLVVRIFFPDSHHMNESLVSNNNEQKYEINILIPNGIGFSLINASHEELFYGRFKGVYLNLIKNNNSYMCSFNVHTVQIDNQLNETQNFNFFFCKASKEKERMAKFNSNSSLSQDQEIMYCLASPAMKIELNYTLREHYDSFECFKILFSNIDINLDEQLLWKFIEFIQESGTAESVMQVNLLQPPNIDLDNVDNLSMRRCYFGNLVLNIGNISLSVTTIPINAMSKKLQKIKQNFNIRLMSFENASITLPPFVQRHTFETISFLVECLRKFYMNELYTQTLNIIVSLDAFGNPLGLAMDIKDSFQTLIFEGNVSGFVSGFSYGVANSFSKVISSMATGVGALITDKEYELKRRKAIKVSENSNEKNPLTHLYSGFKGLGTGVIGGATAIVGNTMKETRSKGLFVGLVKGVGTGVVDTVTKPVQGVFDFIGGTATAMKEVAGSGHIKKQYIPTKRLRPFRVCNNLYGLLQPYRIEYAKAQQLISSKLNNSSSNSILLEIETYHEQKIGNECIQLCALICSDKTYFLEKNNGNYTKIINILDFKYLVSYPPLIPEELEKFDKTKNHSVIIASLHDSKTEKIITIKIMVYSYEKAQILCDKLNRAKELYDRASKNI